MMVRITSAEVCGVRTTSSSGITFAGEKKCMPTTSCGRLVARAISVTSRVEVFVASTAAGFATRSRAAKIFRLRSMLSKMASMITSASLRSV